MSSISSPVCVNTRILHGNLTGVQRTLLELLSAMEGLVPLETVRPTSGSSGVRGHLWEQLALPRQLKGRLLWSPSNTGPLSVERQIVTIHDVVPLDHPEWLNPRFAAWYRWLTPRLARRVRHIVTVSEFTKSRLMEITGVPAEKISVIPNGVSAAFSRRTEEEISAVRTKLGIPTANYILSLGSLEPRKNLPRLLEAWGRVVKELPEDMWLVIAGGKGTSLVFGDVRFDRIPDRVHFTGRVPDDSLPALYSGACGFAYLSVYEGFGIPPLEAMACGVPTLVGNLTSLPEVVGDAAISIDPFSIDDICAALSTLSITSRDKKDSAVKKGYLNIEKFQWKYSAKKMDELFAHFS